MMSNESLHTTKSHYVKSVSVFNFTHTYRSSLIPQTIYKSTGVKTKLPLSELHAAESSASYDCNLFRSDYATFPSHFEYGTRVELN